MRYIFFWFVLLNTAISFGQNKIKAQIIDIDSRVPLAFCKVEYLNKTITTNWEGKFELDIKEYDKPLVIKYKGYQTKNVYISRGQELVIIKMAIMPTGSVAHSGGRCRAPSGRHRGLLPARSSVGASAY